MKQFGPILSATVTVADLDTAAARYERWLDLRIVAHGRVEEKLAIAWDAPAMAGQGWVLLLPESRTRGGLRLVATPAPVPLSPLTTLGWSAVELSVQDVPALAERLRSGPFRIVGAPRPLGSNPAIQAMQVAGPDGEVLYLSDVRAYGGDFRLTRAERPIDCLFVAVLACADLERQRGEYEARFGLSHGSDSVVDVPVLNDALELPAGTRHRISSAQLAGNCLIEFDGYGAPARPRPAGPGFLPPGIAMVTVAVDLLPGAAGAGPADPPYEGRRFAVERGAGGELLELVEAGAAAS